MATRWTGGLSEGVPNADVRSHRIRKLNSSNINKFIPRMDIQQYLQSDTDFGGYRQKVISQRGRWIRLEKKDSWGYKAKFTLTLGYRGCFRGPNRTFWGIRRKRGRSIAFTCTSTDAKTGKRLIETWVDIRAVRFRGILVSDVQYGCLSLLIPGCYIGYGWGHGGYRLSFLEGLSEIDKRLK